MAPRRGGSSSSSRYSSSTCPDAFQSPISIAPFANDVIFFVVFLGITIAICILRKKGVAGKALLGLPLIACLSFFLLTCICSIIATVLLQCEATDYMSYYSWNVAIVIFTYISYWLFLVVVVFSLNTMLRRQLDAGRSNMIFKIVPLVIIGVMGALSCAVAGMTAYINYASGHRFSARYSNSSFANLVELAYNLGKLRAAYYSLYLVSLLASGALALMTIMSLRKARKAGGDLIGWVAALSTAMVFWSILMIVFAAWYLQGNNRYNTNWITPIVLSYLVNFGQALSFILILCITKHVSWREQGGAKSMDYQPQYAPVANPISHSYQPYGYDANATGPINQHHQSPEFIGTNNTVRT